MKCFCEPVACNLHKSTALWGAPVRIREGKMRMKPYRTLEELPQSLRNELPENAQRMYLAVYQRVWETAGMGGGRSDGERAATAHDAAILEVQRRFEKDEQGEWVQAPVDDEIDRDKLEGGAPDRKG
jgi:cation transport regulator